MANNPLDNYSKSRIVRRCGQLHQYISFEEVQNSPYFRLQKNWPKTDIQYEDGIKGTVGWGFFTRPIQEKHTVPFSHEEMKKFLSLSK